MTHTEVWVVPGQPTQYIRVNSAGEEIGIALEQPNPMLSFVNDVTDDIYAKWHTVMGPDREPPMPSRIVLCGLGMMLLFQQFSGFALPLGASSWQGSPTYPEQGGFFAKDSDGNAQVAKLLRHADSDSWRGFSADFYESAVGHLRKSVQLIADNNSKMEHFVNNQADCVTETQLGLGVEQDGLISAYPMVCSLEADPVTANVAFVLALSITFSALVAGLGLLVDCVISSDKNACRANKIDYGAAINAVQ